jgi:hypothetical protein
MVKYTVVGVHRVSEIPPGGVVDLDPKDRGTLRLLERGQIVRQTKPVSTVVDSNEKE